MSRAAVVLPVRHAPETLESTLRSLWPQCLESEADLIVCVADRDPTLRLAERQTGLYTRLIVVPGTRSVPELRAAGARAAAGADYVVIAEDHCLFPPGWLAALLHAAREHAAPVTGGGVANGRRGYVGWAQYFTRYSSFAPDADSGWTRALPGNNACYRREVLDRHADLLTEGFWEAEFNAEVARKQRFWRQAGIDVEQRQVRGGAAYLELRFHHGRCYGARRWSGAAWAQRARLLARSPLIPLVLFTRTLRAILPNRQLRARFFATALLVASYQFAWACGEITGYLLGPADSCSRTD